MFRWMLWKLVLPAAILGILASNAYAQSSCAADLDGNGVVDARDLGAVLGGWGPCVSCGADTNGDAFVDAVDLAAVLSRWGGTCAPTVTSLTPIGGQLAGGAIVTISGDRRSLFRRDSCCCLQFTTRRFSRCACGSIWRRDRSGNNSRWHDYSGYLRVLRSTDCHLGSAERGSSHWRHIGCHYGHQLFWQSDRVVWRGPSPSSRSRATGR